MSNANEILRGYRLKQGLSPEDFAKTLGIAEPTLRSLENGTRSITLDRAKDIVRATDGEITPHDLMPELFPKGFEFPPDAKPARKVASA